MSLAAARLKRKRIPYTLEKENPVYFHSPTSSEEF